MKALILCAALLSSSPLYAAQLLIDLGSDSRTWQTEELLKHPEARDIRIKDDVSYKREMQYRAVPMAVLLKGLKAEDHLQAVALDGFAAMPKNDQEKVRTWLISHGAEYILNLNLPRVERRALTVAVTALPQQHMEKAA